MLFQSKYRRYRVVVVPSTYRFDSVGNRYFQKGISVKFENYFYRTDDEQIINALKNNPMYGVDFWSLDEPKSIPSEEGEKIRKTIEETKQSTLTDCPFCGKTFKNRLGLIGHIRFAHPGEKLS